jgi:hypothetical protein
MRTVMSSAIRLFGLLTLITLSLAASGASWAEQREVNLLRGPMSMPTERPIVVTCSLAQSAACNDAGVPSCNAICNNPKQGAGDCGNCKQDATARCLAACQ